MKKHKFILSVSILSVLLFTFIQLCGYSAGFAENEKNRGRDEVDQSGIENTTQEEETDPAIEEVMLFDLAGDVYRPAGYDEHIGSALALKMSLHKDEPEYLYRVSLNAHTNKADKKSFILSSVPEAAEFNPDEWVEVKPDAPKWIYIKEYVYTFTAEQIYAFIASGAVGCCYVGSENYDEIPAEWWNSAAGIEAYCEKFGDGLAVANDGSFYCTAYRYSYNH